MNIKKIVLPLILSMVFLFCSSIFVFASSDTGNTKKYSNASSALIDLCGAVPDSYDSDLYYVIVQYNDNTPHYMLWGFENYGDFIFHDMYMSGTFYEDYYYHYCENNNKIYKTQFYIKNGNVEFGSISTSSYVGTCDDTGYKYFGNMNYFNMSNDMPYIVYSDMDVYYYGDNANMPTNYYESNAVKEISNFNDYCIVNGLGEFPYYDEDYNYIYWYYQDLGKYMVYSYPKDCESDVPIWYEYDGSYQLHVDPHIDSYFEGYMWDRNNKAWVINVSAGDRALSVQPQFLYSDVHIYSLVDGNYYLSFQKTSTSASSGGSGSSGDTDSSLGEEEHRNWLERIFDSISGGFSSLGNTISNLFNSVLGIIKDISKFQSTINSNLLQGFKDVVSGIGDKITDGASSIVTGIKNVFIELFVPTEQPFEEIFQLLQEKIPIASQMYGLFGYLIIVLDDFDYSNYEPCIPLDLEGFYGYDGEVNVFDFSWYEPYRETVCGLLSAFIWLSFCITVIKYIPKIIGGI